MENENNRMTPDEATVNAEGTEICVEPVTENCDAEEIPVVEDPVSVSSDETEEDAALVSEEDETEDSETDSDEVTTPETPAEKFSRKCAEAKKCCLATADRILHDLKETNCNPYIRQTRTCKVEIFRNAQEETPVDVFEETETRSYSARAMALASGAALIAMLVAKKAISKFMLKK